MPLHPAARRSDPACMRFAMLLVLLAAGGARLVEPTVEESVAAPPIEIRIDGRTDEGLESRIARVQADFPDLRRHRTQRFEILSDLEPDEVASHRRLLERTAHAVEDFRVALGIDWGLDDAAPELVIAFATQEDFIRFAAREDAMNARWLAGYFSPRHGHLAYHDARDHPGVRRLEGRRRTDVVARADAEIAIDGGSPHEGLRRFISRTNASVVVHEATHMLLHRRDILSATTDTPLWLAEGLAGSFEPVEPERRFGPTRPCNGRTAEFRRLLGEDGVPSIRWMLAQDDMPEATDQQAFYASSAALCSWLVRQRPEGMRRYLELMPRRVGSNRASDLLPESDGTRSRHELVFEAAFGSLAELERDWLAWERAVSDTAISVVADDE